MKHQFIARGKAAQSATPTPAPVNANDKDKDEGVNTMVYKAQEATIENADTQIERSGRSTVIKQGYQHWLAKIKGDYDLTPNDFICRYIE